MCVPQVNQHRIALIQLSKCASVAMGCVCGHCRQRTAPVSDTDRNTCDDSNIYLNQQTVPKVTTNPNKTCRNKTHQSPNETLLPNQMVAKMCNHQVDGALSQIETCLYKIIYRTRAALKTARVSVSHEDSDDNEQTTKRFRDEGMKKRQAKHLVRQHEISSSESLPLARVQNLGLHSMGRKEDDDEKPIYDRSSPFEVQFVDGNAGTKSDSVSSRTGPKSGECEFAIDKQDVSSFASIQQLCYELINRALLNNKHDQIDLGRTPSGRIGGKVLCLFLFGSQGSSRGELAYELVEHSSLSSALKTTSAESSSGELNTSTSNLECPLYSYIDVATLIVANIDARIREYNQLVVRTMQRQRKQNSALKIALQQKMAASFGCPATATVASESTKQNDDSKLSSRQQSTDTNESNEGEANEDGGYQVRKRVQGNKASSLSEVSSSASIAESMMVDESQQRDKELVYSEDSSLFTLSTKQRSMLQLKLIKYSNCVASDWVTKLIRTEIDNIEARFDRSWCLRVRRNASGSIGEIPSRVYLINLVPDQLSLFKSCLYLQQGINLREFRYTFWAIKFEKRTNSKLIGEGKAANKAATCSENKIFTGLRIPMLRLAGSSSTSKLATNEQSVETDTLSEVVNEKLGPKFNENFSKQFNSKNRLIRLQYNPTSDYNYDNRDDDVTDADSKRCSSYLTSLKSSQTSQPLLKKPPKLDRAKSVSSQELDIQAVTNELEASHRRLATPSSPVFSLSPCRPSISSVGTTVSSHSSVASNYVSDKHPTDRPTLQGPLVGPLCAADVATYESPKGFSDNSAMELARYQPEWAIELELYDSSTSSSSLTTKAASASQLINIWNHWPLSDRTLLHDLADSSPSSALYLKTYQPPSRSSSRSALKFVAAHTSTQPSAHNYQLFAVRISLGSATGETMIMLVAKRVHRQLIRLRNNSDIVRLNKIITKGRNSLLNDYDAWLSNAIKSDFKIDKMSTTLSHKGNGAPALATRKRAIMVTYAIRVDVACIKTGRFSYDANFDGPTQADCKQQRFLFGGSHSIDEGLVTGLGDGKYLSLVKNRPAAGSGGGGGSSGSSSSNNNNSPLGAAPMLTINDDNGPCRSFKWSQERPGRPLLNLSPPGSELDLPKRPTSTIPLPLDSHASPISDMSRDRPLSSRSANFVSPSSRPKKHVKFRLARGPDDRERHTISTSAPLKPQSRYWINEYLFLCSKEASTSELMALVASLLRFVWDQQ